jgi:hypothetical protein
MTSIAEPIGQEVGKNQGPLWFGIGLNIIRFVLEP